MPGKRERINHKGVQVLGLLCKELVVHCRGPELASYWYGRCGGVAASAASPREPCALHEQGRSRRGGMAASAACPHEP